MSSHRDTVRRYWECAEARDWDGFAATLAPDVVCDLPQTGERVVGRESYVRFNAEYPGDWHLSVTRLVADENGAVSETSFDVGGESVWGISLFAFDGAGLIVGVRDYWPESYEPPAGREHLVARC